MSAVVALLGFFVAFSGVLAHALVRAMHEADEAAEALRKCIDGTLQGDEGSKGEFHR